MNAGRHSLLRLQARGVIATFDEELGQLADFAVLLDGKWHRPLARVPWYDNPPDCAAIDAAPHLARMAGDFFCAPFAASDIEHAPPHGWSANSAWTRLFHGTTQEGAFAAWQLERPVMGARITKRWELRHDLPFLLQEHVIEGGSGALSFAHHVMIDIKNGATVHFSSRAWAETPDLGALRPQDFASAVLAYPARTADLTRFPRADGGTADLTQHPIAERHDDFVMIIDGPAATGPGSFGWAAVDRPKDADRVILIKPADLMPQTMLWLSNGGRTHLPWNGEHRGVLGIEDACAYSLYGHAASTPPNKLVSEGVPTSIPLGSTTRIPYVLGVFSREDESSLFRQISTAVGIASQIQVSGLR